MAIGVHSVRVNNETWDVMSETITFSEGFGEYKVRSAISGNITTTIFSQDGSTRIAKCNFSLPNTNDNIDRARQAKVNYDNNVIIIEFNNGETRTFNQMVITNEYDVDLGSEGTIDLEWMGTPAS